MRAWMLLILGLSFCQAWAASPFKRSLVGKQNKYIVDGVVLGGKAGSGSSLLGVRRAYSDKKKMERVILDLGDSQGRPLGKKMSYFQVNVEGRKNRVVVDLSQILASKISEAQLQRMFKKSPFIKSAELTLDPEDRAASMILHTRKPLKVEVYQLLENNRPGRVVLDFVPLKSKKRAKK